MTLHESIISNSFALRSGSLGLLLGFLYSFGGLIIDSLVSLDLLSSETFQTPGLNSGTVLAFGALFILPPIFYTIGLIISYIVKFIFPK